MRWMRREAAAAENDRLAGLLAILGTFQRVIVRPSLLAVAGDGNFAYGLDLGSLRLQAGKVVQKRTRNPSPPR
jgi:hypothetical protein